MSKSGYYKSINREPSLQAIRKEEVCKEIVRVHNESHQIYGAPKIAEILKNTESKTSVRTITNYMRELDISACYIKKKTKTTITKGIHDELKNVLKREFNPPKPNCVWVTDITYVWTKDGFVYLTSIMDLYSRKIIAWDVSDSLSLQSVIKCVTIAKQRRITDNALIIHSDRGVQYTSKDYQNETMDFILSYSRKGNPWDNACIESFHSLIKREWLNRYKIRDINHASQLCFEYIETFYNTVRIHSHNGYISPNDAEKISSLSS